LDCSTCATRVRGTINGVNRAWSFRDLVDGKSSYSPLMQVMYVLQCPDSNATIICSS
jgi:hypothetical protein